MNIFLQNIPHLQKKHTQKQRTVDVAIHITAGFLHQSCHFQSLQFIGGQLWRVGGGLAVATADSSRRQVAQFRQQFLDRKSVV